MNHILLNHRESSQMPLAKRRVVDAFASAASFALCGVTVLVLGHWLVHPSGVKDGRFDGATNPRVFVEYLSNECALMVIAAAAYLTIALLRQQRHGGAEGDAPPGRDGGGGEGAATAAAAATATAAAAASPSASLGSPLAWIASVRRRCGTSLAVVVATVYFAQGFKSIASLALAIYMKDTMHLSPGVSQSLTATMGLPWAIKPLYGVLSDCVPICGLRRKPWVLLAGVAGTAAWLGMWWCTSMRVGGMGGDTGGDVGATAAGAGAAAVGAAGAGAAGAAGASAGGAGGGVAGGSTPPAAGAGGGEGAGVGEAAAVISTTLLLVLGTISSLSTAVSDVIVDAMVAEKVCYPAGYYIFTFSLYSVYVQSMFSLCSVYVQCEVFAH